MSWSSPPPLIILVRVRFSDMDGDDQLQTKLFDELCGLVFALLRSLPPPFPQLRPSGGAVAAFDRRRQRSQFTPAGLASLLLGASLALMLCGSVTFVLGCILLPWIIGVVMFFYFVGVISRFTGFGKAILCLSLPAPVEASPKEEDSGEGDALFNGQPIRTKKQHYNSNNEKTKVDLDQISTKSSIQEIGSSSFSITKLPEDCTRKSSSFEFVDNSLSKLP